MEMLKNALNWFEIPVADFERAQAFYARIFDFEMHENTMAGVRMGFFLFDPEQAGIGGAIVTGERYTPSDSGTMVYLNGGSDLKIVLDRIETAGGSIVMGKTQISPEIGYMALFLDTEGNRVALHSHQ
jgi:hypothetical protein